MPFIFYSGQGVQYASFAHTSLLLEAEVKISLSDEASPTQDGIVERFMRTVKERVDYADYQNYEDAFAQLKHWLEVEHMTDSSLLFPAYP